jgi:hypothetical protein
MLAQQRQFRWRARQERRGAVARAGRGGDAVPPRQSAERVKQELLQTYQVL